MNKNQALERFDKSRQQMRKTLELLSAAELTQPQVEGVWTIEDLLAHLTSWEEVCLPPFKSFASGGPFRVEVVSDIDAWNAEQVALRRDRPLQAILTGWEAVRREMVATLTRLSADQWGQTLLFPWGERGTASELVNGLSWHEEEHLKTIQAWLKEKEPRHE